VPAKVGRNRVCSVASDISSFLFPSKDGQRSFPDSERLPSVPREAAREPARYIAFYAASPRSSVTRCLIFVTSSASMYAFPAFGGLPDVSPRSLDGRTGREYPAGVHSSGKESSVLCDSSTDDEVSPPCLSAIDTAALCPPDSDARRAMSGSPSRAAAAGFAAL